MSCSFFDIFLWVLSLKFALRIQGGINKTTLHKLYNDDLTRIDFDTIDRVCDFLDIQVGDLFVFERKNDPVSQENNHDMSDE